MAVRAGVVEWDKTALVLGMHVSTLLQKQLHHAHAIVAGSKMERS